MTCDDSQCTQITINGDLTLPGNKPDIERILRVASKQVLTETILKNNKVIFSGELNIALEYVALVPENTQPVHFASFTVPFANFIECISIDSDTELNSTTEFEDFCVIDLRTIRLTAILKVCVSHGDEYSSPYELRQCPLGRHSCETVRVQKHEKNENAAGSGPMVFRERNSHRSMGNRTDSGANPSANKKRSKKKVPKL